MAAHLVAGIDIGNSTTEVCLARVGRDGLKTYLSAGLCPTTGVKGTPPNAEGAISALLLALEESQLPLHEVSHLFVNDATPVISGLAMDTITETVITESSMIGHNPHTPGGAGLGVGVTVSFEQLADQRPHEPCIVVVPVGVDFEDAAAALNTATRRGIDVVAAVLGSDDAVLVFNRLDRPIPIVDEVAHTTKVPLGMTAAVEVAAQGRSVRTVSDVYGLAGVFALDPEATRAVAPVARALTGTRSAVVIRTPAGDVTGRAIPAGVLTLQTAYAHISVDVGDGAEAIMAAVRRARDLEDVSADAGSNAAGMLASVKHQMARHTDQLESHVHIQDLLAIDTFVPQAVRGGLADEVALESAVALAAMVRTSHGPMKQVAAALTREVQRRAERVVHVVVGGVEAEMAVLGALTTPGTERPLVVLDLGGGSTDAARLSADGSITSTHLAGAGDLVTKLIDAELGLDDLELAEAIKRAPLVKVESFFHVRHEDGSAQFFADPLGPHLFARVAVLTDEGIAPIPTRHSIDRVAEVRRTAKRRVFCANAVRALARVAPHGDLRHVGFVVLLGGCALDFEIPQLIAEALAEHKIVCGRGNIRGTEGPRNAVASGLVASGGLLRSDQAGVAS